ncbi:MAG: hypothetical protein AABZ12_08360 [Planctomycetota bacterium]
MMHYVTPFKGITLPYNAFISYGMVAIALSGLPRVRLRRLGCAVQITSHDECNVLCRLWTASGLMAANTLLGPYVPRMDSSQMGAPFNVFRKITNTPLWVEEQWSTGFNSRVGLRQRWNAKDGLVINSPALALVLVFDVRVPAPQVVQLVGKLHGTMELETVN